MKENLGWTKEPFEIPAEVSEHCAQIARRGASRQGKWKRMFKEYAKAYPELAATYKKFQSGELPDLKNTDDLFNVEKPDATRNT